ncbi:MAG: two-component regulator propeller domain-containing protein [Bacteroidota bacterium]
MKEFNYYPLGQFLHRHIFQRIPLFLLSLLLTVGAIPLHSQTMPFINYTIQDGLPQSTVYALFQDRDGYLWAGTQGGACSFDGHHFQVWDSQLDLPDNHVTSISQGSDGTIWFGHRSGAVSFLKNKKIHPFRHAQFSNGSTINSMVWKDKQLYLATEGNGLYCLSFGQSPASVTHFTSQQGIRSDTLKQIILKNDHALWLATAKGLSLWDINNNRLAPMMGDCPWQEKINTVCQLPDSTLWCGTPSGAMHLNPRKGMAIIAKITKANGLLNTNIQRIIADREGNIWLATEQGIARINRQGVRYFTKSNGLLSDLTYDLLADREGNLWISQDDGISYYKDAPFELYTQQDGLVHKEVYTILEYTPGCYWIGTAEGISVFKPGASPSERFRSITTRQGLPGNFIYKIFRDSRKNIWIATIGHGVACYQTDRKRFVAFDSRHGLRGKKVASIQEDRKGRIWFATLDAGIAVYRYETNAIQSYQAGEGFVSNSVWTIHRDAQRQLWFGTKDQGLVRLDDTTDTFEIVPGQAQLPNHNFGSISSDSRGNIWIGSIGGGIFQYDGHTFRQYGIRQGLKSNNPYFIFCDRNDRIWLGTNVGIDLFNPLTHTVVNYGQKEGFMGIETNQNAVCQDSKGDVWIGTVNGLMHAQANLEDKPTFAPLVSLLRQRLFFEETNLYQGQRLDHDQNHLSFDFLGISLAHTNKVSYRYWLQGLDQHWSPILTASQASYPNLPPGSYTFLVKAGFEKGKWSQPIAFSFVIAPPFWKTWWFILLACLAFVALISIAYQYRVAHLLKLERVRNKIAIDLHDDIGSALSSISIFSEVASRQLEQKAPPETTREIVSQIGHHARAMLDAMDDIVWAVNPQNDHFEDLAVRMREFAIPLLEAKNIVFDINIQQQLLEAKLAMETRKNIYFVFKEAVNNLLKHSDCCQVWITVRKTADQVELLIKDDGKGFPADQVNRRNGLKNMQSRATEIGGIFEINSEVGKGTCVRLTANII